MSNRVETILTTNSRIAAHNDEELNRLLRGAVDKVNLLNPHQSIRNVYRSEGLFLVDGRITEVTVVKVQVSKKVENVSKKPLSRQEERAEDKKQLVQEFPCLANKSSTQTSKQNERSLIIKNEKRPLSNQFVYKV